MNNGGTIGEKETDAFIRSVREHSQEKQLLVAEDLGEYRKRLNDLRMADHELDSFLKKMLGLGIAIIVILQLLLMDVVFGVYVWNQVLTRGGDISDAVLITWITTTIAQILGLAMVVTKYLFPERGVSWSHEPKSGE